ncbi:MAG: FAD-dependent oxidoreductase [Marinobacter sp.]|uniref:FAD-dependent oxidoreductase n=1 Tax=Marinobacter sp. TaxID=50741 RepID=UPI00299F41DC|nr:FAD-dependent oxidoreductase [Marinobacter sp.]MDX1633082.1 FAD-dependent oxidoreductase [Marinobacter sp.]
MAEHRIKLQSKEEVAVDTMAFHFEKPEGFQFKAGQTAEWKLIDPPETDSEGNSRTFTIASAPYENTLMCGTRMRDSAYKRSLEKLKPGDEILLDGPGGSFKLHNDESTPAVFLTGGIGVTAVRSILLQALKDKVGHKLVVFYSNHRPEDAAFLEELDQSRDNNPDYTFVPTMTQMDKSDQSWHGETGHVDKAMLEKYLDDLTKPIYYLDGPPDMVEGLFKVLTDAGVDEDNIRTEEFPGY